MPPKTVISAWQPKHQTQIQQSTNSFDTVTCVDPRVFPEELLGLKMGEAFIFRTIAGQPQPIFEQLIGLDRTSFNFEDVWLLYHTDCGAQYFNEEKIRSGLLETDPSATRKIDHMDFGTMKGSVEESLKEDMAWLKNQTTVRQGLRDAVKGFMWDIKSGELREVK